MIGLFSHGDESRARAQILKLLLHYTITYPQCLFFCWWYSSCRGDEKARSHTLHVNSSSSKRERRRRKVWEKSKQTIKQSELGKKKASIMSCPCKIECTTMYVTGKASRYKKIDCKMILFFLIDEGRFCVVVVISNRSSFIYHANQFHSTNLQLCLQL